MQTNEQFAHLLGVTLIRLKYMVECSGQDIHKLDLAAKAYVNILATQWPAFELNFQQNEQQGNDACVLMNKMLPDEFKTSIIMSATVGKLNAEDIDAWSRHIPGHQIIEIYISCISLFSNVLAMELIYAHLKNKKLGIVVTVHVFKYKPYNESIEIINELSGEHPIRYDELSIHVKQGLNELGDLITNLIIMAPADKLETRTVTIRGEQRQLKWCKFDISRLLINIIGEHQLTNYVGFIEFVEQSEMPTDTEFYELLDMRGGIDQCNAANKAKFCAQCGRHSLQGQLMQCSKCKKVYYCSRVCQSFNWASHKQFCN
jgi:hypothetical protein